MSLSSLWKKTPAGGGKPPRAGGRLLLVALSLGSAILLVMLFNALKLPQVVEELELKTYDLRAMLKVGSPRFKPSQDIVILKFDDPTLNVYEDTYGAWPWPRQIHADMIRFLNRGGAKAIAYDIMFISSQKHKGWDDGDKALIQAFKDHPNVYLSMNFDNNRAINEQLGKGLKPQDIQRLEPLAISLTDARKKTTVGPVGEVMFDNFRPILPGFFEVKDRIAFVNHVRDRDGVSRSNPLFFRLKGTDRYYPYLGLKLALDLKRRQSGQSALPAFQVTEKNHLVFPGYDIPLTPEGALLVNWYNLNVEEEALRETVRTLEQHRQALVEKAQIGDAEALKLLAKTEGYLKLYQEALNHPFEAKPYREISAWEVLRSMDRQRRGVATAEDRRFQESFRDKVIFIGATAVSTYDIKTTPISKLLPGVILQATLFDNLYQNAGYMRRLPPVLNTLLAGLLCLVAAFSTIKIRSAWSGLATSGVLALAYLVLATWAFKHHCLWINIAMPMVSLIGTLTLTFMVKYISRDEDYEKTYKLATTDGLTGLHNHRFFQEHMANAIAQAARANGKFSLVLVDIDFFKKFNDTYGHQAGDAVLRQVARKLKASVRTVDLVARYGGEEMAVVLDKADEQEALDVAAKLVRLVAEEAYPIAEGIARHVTISVGVATYPLHGKTPAQLIEFADQGLYRAKENGRNQVGAQYDAA